MPGSLEIIFRTLTAFILLWIFVHLLGKQTIFQKTYHLFIATVTMGTIAGNLAFNLNIKFSYFLLAFIIMGAIIFTLNFLSVKNHRYRKWITGEPTFLIKEGKILEESLEKIGYSLDMLTQALRGKDIFNLDEVEFAMLERDGSLSVSKKAEYQNVTRKDIDLIPASNRVPVELVVDGELLEKNFSNQSHNKEWFLAELSKRNLQAADISYAVIGSRGNLYIDLRRDHVSEK